MINQNVVRALSLTLVLATLSGCAGLFGPPADPAPIEDRAHAPAAPARKASAPVAKTIPLPEPPRSVARSPQPANVPAGARAIPAPQLTMTDKSPQRPLSNLPFGAEPLPPEDLPADPLEATDATAGAPALSPAVQSLVAAANAAAAQREWDQAQAALERAVKLAPTKSWVWQQLARTHLQSGDVERAREVAQRALSLAAADGRENVAAWRLMADIEQARGDAAAAQTARNNATHLLH